jgi:hypothetical protein
MTQRYSLEQHDVTFPRPLASGETVSLTGASYKQIPHSRNSNPANAKHPKAGNNSNEPIRIKCESQPASADYGYMPTCRLVYVHLPPVTRRYSYFLFRYSYVGLRSVNVVMCASAPQVFQTTVDTNKTGRCCTLTPEAQPPSDGELQRQHLTCDVATHETVLLRVSPGSVRCFSLGLLRSHM